MEKIFMPHQYAKKYASDHEGKDAVINRMRRARKVDEIIEDARAAQKPEWRGDHSFSSDAARYSLTHFVEPEVAREHPDWTTSQIKEHAKERFEKRLAQDLSYEHRETVHEESQVHWRPVQTENGWELATEYGDKLVTLNELWDHTKEYAAFVGNVAAYNPEEHRAQLAMQDALINDGSQGFVSVLSHPDAVRYVQIWQKSENGDIQSRHVDLFATTGRDFSPQEAAELISHLADYHGETDRIPQGTSEGAYAHFFVSHGYIEEGDVRTFAIAQTIRVDAAEFTGDDGRNIRSSHLIGAVARDTKDAVLSFGAYIHEQIQEKIQSMRLGITERPEKNVPHQSAKARKKYIQRKHTETAFTAGIAPEMNVSINKAAEFTGMKSVLSEWWISRTIVAFVPHVPVAAPAAVYWFAEFSGAHEIKKHADGAPTAENGVQRDVAKRGAPARDILTVWKALVSKIQTFRITPEKRKKDIVSQTNKQEKVAEQKLRPRERSIEVPHVDDKTDQRFALVYEVARVCSQLFGNDDGRRKRKDIAVAVRRGQPRQSEALRSSEAAIASLVGRFLFAASIWELCRIPFHAITGAHRPDEKSNVPLAQREQHDAKIVEDETTSFPWILLSIIWHLTLMREAALTAPTQQQRQRTQVKGKNTPLPQQGVIFTYHFVIE